MEIFCVSLSDLEKRREQECRSARGWPTRYATYHNQYSYFTLFLCALFTSSRIVSMPRLEEGEMRSCSLQFEMRREKERRQLISFFYCIRAHLRANLSSKPRGGITQRYWRKCSPRWPEIKVITDQIRQTRAVATARLVVTVIMEDRRSILRGSLMRRAMGLGMEFCILRRGVGVVSVIPRYHHPSLQIPFSCRCST